MMPPGIAVAFALQCYENVLLNIRFSKSADHGEQVGFGRVLQAPVPILYAHPL